MDKYSTEVLRRVYNDTDGVYLQVGPDSDGLDLVQLSTPGKDNEEYYGMIRLVVTPEQAKLLGLALIDTADELLAKVPGSTNKL